MFIPPTRSQPLTPPPSPRIPDGTRVLWWYTECTILDHVGGAQDAYVLLYRDEKHTAARRDIQVLEWPAPAPVVDETAALRAEVARLREAADILGVLVDALPKCDHCDRPATRAYVRGATRYCDIHCSSDVFHKGKDAPEYPRAPALRRAEAWRKGGARD